MITQHIDISQQNVHNSMGYWVEGGSYKFIKNDNMRRQIYQKALAMDAQPQTVTVPNAGVLSVFTTWIDPKLISVLFAPNRATAVAGESNEVRKGTWIDTTIVFNMIEFTGQVASYDDFSNNGVSNLNTNYPQRQPYNYQVITQWGIQELERMGAARIDWAAQLELSSIFVLNKFQNESYFYGVEGLQNYGLLNDPGLNPFIPASAPWSTYTEALPIYNDFITLYTDLATNAQGLVNPNTPMTLGLSPYADAQLKKTVSFFTKSAYQMILEQFTNLKFVVAPEFDTPTGQLIRLKADEMYGQPTEQVSYNEKLRAFKIFVDLSSYRQKKMQGTNGAIIYYPVLISNLIGV